MILKWKKWKGRGMAGVKGFVTDFHVQVGLHEPGAKSYIWLDNPRLWAMFFRWSSVQPISIGIRAGKGKNEPSGCRLFSGRICYRFPCARTSWTQLGVPRRFRSNEFSVRVYIGLDNPSIWAMVLRPTINLPTKLHNISNDHKELPTVPPMSPINREIFLGSANFIEKYLLRV
jgi:hypothetical protein